MVERTIGHRFCTGGLGGVEYLSLTLLVRQTLKH